MDSRYKQIIDNVQSMVNKGAQGEDITGYLAYEGLTPTQFKKLVEGPTFGGYVKEFFKGVPSGAIGLAETAGVGASSLLPEEYEKPTRKFIEETGESLRKPFAPEIGYEDTIPRKAGEAIGSTVPFFALGPLGTAGRVVGVGTGVAAGAGEARIGAEQAGATDSDRALATILGAPTGLLDIIAPELKLAKGMVVNALVKGGVEGATEAAQKVSQNLIAKGIYNPEQPILLGSGEEGAYGAGAGALASLLVDLATGRRGSSAKAPPGAPPVGVPSTATQPDLLGGDTAGYRAVPAGEVYSGLTNMYGQPIPPMEVPSARGAQETEAERQNRLFQITGMRSQYDVLERELGRLQAQFNAPTTTVEEKQAILERADELNTARTDLESQIKEQSKGLEDTERAGAVAEPEQRELDFDVPAMPRQRTGEGVVLGEESDAPTGLTPEQSEMFRQERIKDIQARIDAGQMVTPADQAFLRMDEREQRSLFEARPTPELFTPEERPDFRLGPQYLEPSVAEVPAVEARPITEADFKKMGIGATNKKLREAILDKDLTDPVQREEVKEILTDFANNPNRSEKVIEGVSDFLSSPAFMEQGELDLRPARKPRAKKAKEPTDVTQPTEPIEQPSEFSPTVVEQRGEEPSAGIETPESTGMGAIGEPSEQPVVGEAVQPTTLETPTEGKVTPQQATSRLIQEGNFTPKEARETVENLTDGYNEVSIADIEDELSRVGKPAATKEKYTPEQRKEAEGIASDLGGQVVWQEGDNALIRAYGVLTGKPVYVAAKGNRYTTKDIESYTGTMFASEERARLVAEKKRQEHTATQKHKTTPFLSFDKGHIQTSKGTPKGLGEIVTGWSKLLGLKANIYITTIEDARQDADKFTGPHRAIGSSALNANDIGSMRRMADGSYYIAFTKSTSKTAMLETLAHELGHVHMKEMYNNASPELQNSIKKEFEKWLSSQKGKTARELVDSLRAKTTAKATAVPSGRMADTLSDYWHSFDEWYADQVSRWATTDAKPISVVEKFFARLGRALRTFFGNLKNNRYLANETFVQYLDKVKAAYVQPSDVTDTGESQAQRRTTEALTSEGEKAAALNERMKGIANEPEPDVAQSYKDRLTMYANKSKGVPMKFRQAVVDKDAPVKEQLAAKFQNAVTNSLGEIRPDILNEQAQEATGIADQLMRKGGIRIGKDGLMEVYDREEGGEKISLDRVFEIIVEDLGKKLGSPETAVTLSHRAFIAQRASEINKRNALREKEAEAAEDKGNLAAAKKLRAQIIRVRASQAEIDAGLEAMNTYPELKKAFDVFTKYNEGITDFLVATDRLSPAEAQAWKDNVGYVPWTRMEEEDSKIDSLTKIRVGNTHLTSLPTLDKEGSSKEIRNVLDNMVGHTIWAMRSGMKNRAALKTLEALPAVEELKTQDAVDTERKNNPQLVVFAYRDGQRVAFKVQNKEDVAAFSDIIDVAGPILGIFKAASTTLRSFVTHMPTFALSQLSQDTVRAMFLSGVKHPFSLPSKVVKNFYKTLTNEASDMQALGITGSYDGMPDNAMRKMRERHGLQDRAAFKRMWDKLEDFSLAADMAVRAAIYEQTMQETGDRVLAFHRAKEYINFKTQGNGQAVRILRQIVPFMNAYIQGMDVLYRTIQGKGISGADKKEAIALFMTTGMKVAALSTLYAMLVGDDEDYKGLDDRERDNSFIIPGTGLKMPVAPEIGFLFKVIPERLYQATIRAGTDRPVDATSFMRGMRDAAINAYGGMNITPQLVKPAIEVATNHSFFTGNPIVGIRMAEAETRFQFNDHTSEIAKLLGNIGISPMKADHLLRGYFGTVGGVVLDVTDAVADPNRMNKPVNKLPLVKTFMYDDTGRGYKSEFYAFREDVDKVVNSVNILKSQGRIDELQEYLTEDKLKRYAMKGVVNKVEETLGKLRQYRNIIANDPDLSPAEKREKTDEMLQQEKEILKMYNVPQMKQMAGM